MSATGTPHYAEIDEGSGSEDTGDYVYRDGEGTRTDDYTMENPSGSIDEVTGITIYMYLITEYTDNMSYRARFYDGSSWSSWKGDTTWSNLSYTWKSVSWTGLSISASDIQSLRVELELEGYNGCWGDAYIRCATLEVEITYTEVTGWDGGDVNGVDHSNIGKVNSVDISNINKINSV